MIIRPVAYLNIHREWGRRVIGILGFPDLRSIKTLMEVIFGEVRRAQLAKSTLLTSTLGP